jgi:hypothetical protein
MAEFSLYRIFGVFAERLSVFPTRIINHASWNDRAGFLHAMLVLHAAMPG